MKHIKSIIIVFFLFIMNVLAQGSKTSFKNSMVTNDKSLKEVWEYKIEGVDSSLRAREYYSNALLQYRQEFSNDSLRKEITYKYNEGKQPSLISEVYKGQNKKDTSKSISIYLYDQYHNQYLERHMDSITDLLNPFHIRYQRFTNYIYEDSLIIYSNTINDLGNFFQIEYKRFEYDDKKNLRKIYYREMNDTTGIYNLTEELFYDGSNNLIKTIRYCQDYVTNIEGKKIKRPCEDDFTLYAYNSKQQLIEEFHHFHNILFANPLTKENVQKDIINYIYDEQETLVSVLHTKELQGKKHFINRHLKY